MAAAAAPLTIDGTALEASGSYLSNNTTYVPIRTVTEALRPDAAVSWSDGQAVVSAWDLNLTARPGDLYIQANGRCLYVPDGVQVRSGRVLVPVRTLGAALGAQVDWDAATGSVSVTGGASVLTHADSYYNEDDLYWLSVSSPQRAAGNPCWGRSPLATWCSTGPLPLIFPIRSTVLSLTAAGAASLNPCGTARSTTLLLRAVSWRPNSPGRGQRSGRQSLLSGPSSDQQPLGDESAHLCNHHRLPLVLSLNLFPATPGRVSSGRNLLLSFAVDFYTAMDEKVRSNIFYCPFKRLCRNGLESFPKFSA